MAIEIFKKEISYLSKIAKQSDAPEAKGGMVWVDEIIKKTATFKELSRTDKDQHKLHFKIISLFQSNGVKDEESTANINSDALYDITVKSIKTLIIIDPEFTEEDKQGFLCDSSAILSFAFYMLKEHFTPFFSKLNIV